MTTQQEYQKPLPIIEDDNRPFWEACKRHELVMQQCDACQTVWWPIGPVCQRCLSDRWHWQKLSGRGELYSFVIFHQLFHPGYKDDIPYNVVMVRLEEGPHMFSNLVGVPNDQIAVGAPVEVTFDDVTDEISLPKFKPRT
ncbi:MAG TPA: OB-fold domain-containing protein [Dehalococcoidia bacterium]|nr:OB-fold domain-containing protein [Dehalococcoidia bacterium]